MKKYLIYTGILVVGLLIGRLISGNASHNETTLNNNKTAESNQMWTCAMHPQIMQPESGDCPICGMDLTPAENGVGGLTTDQFRLSKNAMALANIQTSIVDLNKMNDNTLKLSGEIFENEESNEVQVSYFSGRIEKLNINYTGEKVRKGQLLATIYSPELFAAQQELITAASLKESQPKLYNAVRNKLKLWKLTDTQINQIEASGKVKENFSVYATVSGTVSKKLVEQGAYIKQGQALLKITNLSTVWANFDVYEHQIDLFKKGQKVTIKTNAYPDKTFKAKVVFIDPILNTKTRTIQVRTVLDNKAGMLKPGMFIEGTIKLSKANTQAALIIPSSAILWTGKRSVVYLKKKPNEPVFELQEVTLGKRIGKNYIITDGLQEGDEIVTNGTFSIDAAAQLLGKKSMMNNEETMKMTDHKEPVDKDSNSSKTSKDNTTTKERIEVPADFQKQLKAVFNNYIELTEALVYEDTVQSTESAKELLTDLARMDRKLLPDTKQNYWTTIEKELERSATSISKSSNIETQRMHFKQLSAHLAKALLLYGIGEKVYYQFCPMADDFNGAYWLSKEEKVINPYFGESMLNCGETEQIIE